MAWSPDRRRFVAALGLFVLWVMLLAALAIVSAYRPAVRNAVPDQPAVTSEPATEANEK